MKSFITVIFAVCAFAIPTLASSSGPNYAALISPCPGGLQNENDDGSCRSKRDMNKFMFRNVMNEKRAAAAEPEVVQVDA